MGGGVAAIAHAVWAFGVIALGDLANPVGRVAGHRGDFTPGATLAEQPQDLPPTAFIGLFGRTVARLQLGAAQMGLEDDVSGHAPSVQLPMSSWYQTALAWTFLIAAVLNRILI